MVGWSEFYMDFDKILLYHPQQKMTYIRKLTMSYGYYTVLATVNHEQKITHIGINNTLQIIPYSKLSDSDKYLLGKKKCENLKDNDLLNIYSINKAIQLKKPYKLHKKCNCMRYTTPEETLELKREILLNKDNVIVIEGNKYYKESYTDNSSIDIGDVDITKELEMIRLKHYEDLLANGQTTLI